MSPAGLSVRHGPACTRLRAASSRLGECDEQSRPVGLRPSGECAGRIDRRAQPSSRCQASARVWSALALLWLAFVVTAQAADINDHVPKGATMGLIKNSRRAVAAPTHLMDRDRGSGSGATNGSSTDQRLREVPRLVLMSAGMYAVGAVILFAVGLILEGVAVSVMAIATTICAVYLRRSHQRFTR